MSAREILELVLVAAFMAAAAGTFASGFWIFAYTYKNLPPGPIKYNSIDFLFLERKNKVLRWFILFGTCVVLMIAIIIIKLR